MDYSLTLVTRINFLEGAIKTLPKELRTFESKRVLCVYDKGIKDAGIVDPILEAIKDEGLELFEYGDVQPSVPYETVKVATEIAREGDIDTIIAIGGGSSMDTAKAVNVHYTQPGGMEAYVGVFGATPIKKPLLKPLICVPTTAGTGSEVSYAAVVWDPEAQLKKALLQPPLAPDVAIIDPVLHAKMPPFLTMSSGLDALAHALEGVGGYRHHPILTEIAMKVCNLVFDNLPLAYEDGSNLDARMNMALAASWGIVAGTNGIHFGHAIGHSIESVTHGAHGITCAFALPEICEWYADVIPDQTRKLCKMLGVDADGLSIPELGQTIKVEMRRFFKKIGFPEGSKIIPDRSTLDQIVKLSMGEVTFAIAEKKASAKVIRQMLESALDNS